MPPPRAGGKKKGSLKAKAPVRRPRSSPRAPRARLEVDERRAQLVELGLDVFASRAYDELSVDELARVAGISKGLLYHYFPTKRDFYVATVREAARQLLELTATSADMPPLERARAGLDAYLDYVDAHAPAYAALMRGGIGSDPEVARIIDETRAYILCERLLCASSRRSRPHPSFGWRSAGGSASAKRRAWSGSSGGRSRARSCGT